jgi:hypothetical protein
MAEFSKQWTELKDNGMGWDFNIIEIAEGLEKGYYTPVICEGFGFTAVGLSESGEIILAFPNVVNMEEDLGVEIEWKKLDTLISKS